METSELPLSRISKLFVDRDRITVAEALARRRAYVVTLVCGSDVATSWTLQLAVITAANIASRCFPGAVRLALAPGLADAPLLLWPSLRWSFGHTLPEVLGREPNIGAGHAGNALVFGNGDPPRTALRVTFDGWIAQVGPAHQMGRLAEREYCTLSGVLAAALALSELFLSFADISIEATRRVVGISLWRPDVDVSDASAQGVPVEFLPGDLWALGLGHLGNAYLWALATLPYQNAADAELYLTDFDRVAPENVDTGMIFRAEARNHYKTRVCAAWLEERGFRTRIIEREFGSDFRCNTDGRRPEPGVALCGFDSNPARRQLATAGFRHVVESGLGGTSANFDTISLHALPNPRSVDELWPDLPAKEVLKEAERRKQAARKNPGYTQLATDECGRIELAGQSVAVPFVGAAAASLVVAEAIRLLHGGPAYTDFKIGLGSPVGRAGRTSGDYSVQDLAGVKYCFAADIPDRS